MTFAATAEIVRYLGAIPILVDCDPVDAEHGSRRTPSASSRLSRPDSFPRSIPRETRVVGIIPVHVGG